jgi:hypothetical protein
MLEHRRNLGAGTESSGSTSSLHGPLNSPKNFHELKDVVQDISRRLAVLEKVFVFVDFEQINQAITNFGAAATACDKVGIDRVVSASPLQQSFAEEAGSIEVVKAKSSTSSGVCDMRAIGCDWQCLPDRRTVTSKEPSSSVPPHTGSLQAQTSHYPAASPLQPPKGRLQPLGPPRSMHSTASLLPPSKLLHSTESPLLQENTEKRACTDRVNDLKDGFGSGVNDDVAKSARSTRSTWAFSSTCDGENDFEPLIEPERFSQFVKQALRPQWQGEHAKESRSQHARRVANGVRGDCDIDDIMQSMLDEKARKAAS